VRCPSCTRDNPHDAAFCSGCGRRLAAGASGPRPLTPEPRAYTPRHLAEKILTSRSALEGERKHVTVLFADVTGSMDLAEQVDPETWHGIMDRFFAILADGVHRFEGTINQFTGDGIMALFGAPIAHEDHAQRGCYAALHLSAEVRQYAEELKRTQGLRFSVRMGLNSGEVVVGKIGDDLRMDYTAQGHTVGLAARMEQLADPGTVYLTEHTAALVAGFFRLRDLGPFTVKGVREPLHVWELQGVGPLRTRLEVSRARGFSRFVGRDAEMAALEAALSRVAAGHGQGIGVVADPGVGKSRLYYEFAQRCRARGSLVYEAHCVAHGQMIPFLPVLEVLRGFFGITEQDGDEEARRKVAGTLLLLDTELTEALPLLLDFLGIPDSQRPAPHIDPEARQRQLVTVAKRLMQAGSRRDPVLLLVEDLHWIDGGSEGFLRALVETLPETRTLFMVNFRPEYDAAWLRQPFCEQLALLPLGAEAITELLTDLLGTHPSVAGLADRIRERTGGNPFFIEEVVQSLVESGAMAGVRGAYRLVRPVEEVPIPATVQAVLAARIDRLAESEKLVLQTAAVIGREVSEPVLRRVVETPADVAGSRQALPLQGDGGLAGALRALVEAGFLYEEALYPEAIYTFRHPLTQEVASRSQLAVRRARVHAVVAAVVAALYPDKLDERAALLAHHWEGAGETLEAARWSRRAAEWVRVSNLAEARRHWQKVRGLLTLLPESPETTSLALDAAVHLIELGWRLGIQAAEAAAIFSGGQALAQRCGDRRAQVMLLNAYAVVRSHFGSADDFVESAAAATQLAEETNDASLRLMARTRLVIALGAAGHLRKALALTEQAVAQPPADLQLGAAILGYSPYVRLMRERGKLLIDLGRLADGVRDLDRAAQLARQHGYIEVLGFTHGEYVTLARLRGDTETALTHARETMRVADKLGSPFFRAAACLSFGQAHILGNKWPEARGACEEALAIARAGHAFVETETLALTWLAAAYRGLGDIRRALTLADEALAVAARRRTRLAECIALIGRARIMLRTDPVHLRAPIEDALSRALSLVEETGARSNEPFVRVELARLAGATGDQATRQRELRSAHRLFTEMGAAPRAARVARELDR
jgi:class 3 adenylate cyclase/tetratricopeptide (TPR) repeat protein